MTLPAAVRLRRTRQPLRLAAVLRWGVAAGLLGATANLLFLAAIGAGQLTVTAVLAGLYPAFTVLLAVVVVTGTGVQASSDTGNPAGVALVGPDNCPTSMDVSEVVIVTGLGADAFGFETPERATVVFQRQPGALTSVTVGTGPEQSNMRWAVLLAAGSESGSRVVRES